MVEAPGDYPWSSYPANAPNTPDPIVTPHACYQSLAASEQQRRAAYRSLFETELDAHLLQRVRDCTNGGFVRGSNRFEQQIAAMVGRRTWRGAPGRPRKDNGDAAQPELVV